MALDISITILTQPKKGFQQLHHYGGVLWAVGILMVAGISRSMVNVSLGFSSYSSMYFLVQALKSVFTTFFSSAVIFCSCRLFNGKATFMQTFQAVAFAYLPFILIGPLSLALILFSYPAQLTIISSFVLLALTIWSLVLIIIGLRETQQFSTGKTILVLLAPVIFISFLLIIAAISIYIF